MEEPPKVTVSINTGIGEYTIYQDTTDYHVANTLSAILEYYGKEYILHDKIYLLFFDDEYGGDGRGRSGKNR